MQVNIKYIEKLQKSEKSMTVYTRAAKHLYRSLQGGQDVFFLFISCTVFVFIGNLASYLLSQSVPCMKMHFQA